VYTLQENLLLSNLIKGLVFSDCVAVYGNMFMLCCRRRPKYNMLATRKNQKLRVACETAKCHMTHSALVIMGYRGSICDHSFAFMSSF